MNPVVIFVIMKLKDETPARRKELFDEVRKEFCFHCGVARVKDERGFCHHCEEEL